MAKPEVVALERAKIQLMKKPNTIFYTTILFSLKTVWTDAIPTAAVDGYKFYFNPEYLLKLTEEQRIGLLVHEILHVALSHMTRRKNRHPKLFNKAGDHVINLSILQTRRYELPPGGLHDARFEDMNTEQVYDILFKEAEKQTPKGGTISLDDIVIPGGEDIIYPENAAEVNQAERDIADVVLKASLQAKSNCSLPGELPGELEVNLQQVLNPKLPWNVILQNFLSGLAKDDYSWSRPNRRYAPEFYLPSAYSEAMGTATIAVDTSGSVSDEEFSFFIAEITSIQETLNPEEIEVIDFDTRINATHQITSETDIWTEVKFTGRGGTQIGPVLEHTKDNLPEVLLVFTDGHFSMPQDKEAFPSCPIIWLIHDYPHFTAPVGEIIHYEIEDYL